MSSELILLVLTAVLAVIAVGAALVAVRASRRPSPPSAGKRAGRIDSHTDPIDPRAAEDNARELSTRGNEQGLVIPAPEPVARIVEGRVIVTPTAQQIVEATMNRPLVRLSIISYGLAHALRPESRDRIMALMRREFHSRHRQRRRAARHAARIEPPRPPVIDRQRATAQAWVGELPPTPQEVIEP